MSASNRSGRRRRWTQRAGLPDIARASVARVRAARRSAQNRDRRPIVHNSAGSSTIASAGTGRGSAAGRSVIGSIGTSARVVIEQLLEQPRRLIPHGTASLAVARRAGTDGKTTNASLIVRRPRWLPVCIDSGVTGRLWSESQESGAVGCCAPLYGVGEPFGRDGVQWRDRRCRRGSGSWCPSPGR